ncbi:MAG TPA: hypothetical protein PKC69_01850 [Chitinophagaceae bacterium]|nr:hypothetical protein [Chitinophagaceae bacterium]
MRLLNISAWWQSLATFDKIFWAIALLFSLLFLIQTVLSFVGGDGDESFGDADEAVGSDDGIGYGFFTIKNFIAFFTIFGWTGIALSKGNVSKPLIIFISLAAGLLVVVIMLLLFRSMGKLRQSGTLQIERAVGSTAQAYLFIPAGRSGIGKIHIRLQGSLRELNAITDDTADIATGKLVKVVSVINDGTLLVTSNLS